MNTKRMAILCGLLVGLLVVGGALAMSSTSFRLDWNAGSSNAGGGYASSTNYQANITIGQTATRAATSTSYVAGFGYWSAFPFESEAYLPLVAKE